MKTSYILNLPYEEKPFTENEFILSQNDIEILKSMAKDEGRSLRNFLARKLKEIAAPQIVLLMSEKNEGIKKWF